MYNLLWNTSLKKIVGENLENIATQLKQARLDMGLTIEDAVKKTKFSKAQINAIEEGNFDFFKSDISYFSYYIRYYANALNYDYELLRPDVENLIKKDHFTQELEVLRRDIDDNTLEVEIAKKPKRELLNLKRLKKVDFSFLAFIIIGVLALLSLIYLGVRYLPDLFKEDPVQPPIVNNGGNDINDNDDIDEEPVEPEKPQIEAVKKDSTHYNIINWDQSEDVEVKVKFGASQTWISFSVNNVVLDEPQMGTYPAGEEAIIIEKPTENKEILLHFGIMKDNEIYINDQLIELDETVKENRGVVKLYLKFIQE